MYLRNEHYTTIFNLFQGCKRKKYVFFGLFLGHPVKKQKMFFSLNKKLCFFIKLLFKKGIGWYIIVKYIFSFLEVKEYGIKNAGGRKAFFAMEG